MDEKYFCEQCGKEMFSLEYIVFGSVCHRCCVENQARVAGKRIPKRHA